MTAERLNELSGRRLPDTGERALITPGGKPATVARDRHAGEVIQRGTSALHGPRPLIFRGKRPPGDPIEGDDVPIFLCGEINDLSVGSQDPREPFPGDPREASAFLKVPDLRLTVLGD